MRAQRFPLQLPLEYRPVGRGQWHRASTKNISVSGVLVSEPNPPTVDTRIEFRLLMSSPGFPACGEVAGRGRVVRLAQPPEAAETGFAVEIERYDFHQRPN